MSGNINNMIVDIDKVILSSKSRVYKTESLIKQIKNIVNVDFFLSKISEAIIKNINSLTRLNSKQSFKVCTSDNKFSFLFKMVYVINDSLGKQDIVFYKYNCGDDNIRQNDQRVVAYLKNNQTFKINVEIVNCDCDKFIFEKLYVLSTVSDINLPLLSKDQRNMIEVLDQNVVVQGVAGSGKTNICLEKLIFSACRNYGGKILYTTYSRGLINNTKLKLESFKYSILDFINKFKSGNVEFLDSDHKTALQNKFGIYFFSDDSNEILNKLEHIVNFLDTKVDYYLIDDLYREYFKDPVKFVGESYFIDFYIKEFKNHHIAKELKKLEQYSYEIIYKEIYGVIFGFYCDANGDDIISKEVYIDKRKDSFGVADCNSIYQIALDYKKHCESRNLIDFNLASKKLLKIVNKIQKYSLTIIDEVQDYTQANLNLFKKISLKLFCVGDALQMINPSFFSFGYLKNLLYEKDIINVSELKNNYRNSKKIEEVIEELGDINTKQFGTHNFVVKGKAVDSALKTETIYINDKNFINRVAKDKFDNFTIVVADNKQKNNLRNIIKNQEILTISEIKGLERDTVVLLNILSDNILKWKMLERLNINRKQADENSIYRYYFNLFYVGVSRAKQNLFVVENEPIDLFKDLFKNKFESMRDTQAIARLNSIVSKLEFSDDELIGRVKEFLNLEQFDNAVFAANKIADDKSRIQLLSKIDIYRNYVSLGNNREAGIKFWELGLNDEARQQFVLSKDFDLIKLLEVCENSENNNSLSTDIVEYYNVVENEMAKKLILSTLEKEIQKLNSGFKETLKNFKKLKEGKGKHGQ